MRHESAESRTALPEETDLGGDAAPLKQEIRDEGRGGRQADVPPDFERA